MTIAAEQQQQKASSQVAARGPSIHLAYLDGVRGLAALYVLLEHVQLGALDLLQRSNPAPGSLLLKFARLLDSTVLGYGHLAVDVFIVLSGYCLMLPVAASADRNLRGGLVGYIKRRAWRIIPPYYAALGVALAISLVTGAYHMFTAGHVVAHLLLVHNLSPDWLYSINAPMWSIAVEWQIYFVFALLLLPVWRRMGNGAALLAGLALGLSPIYLLPAERNFEWACPWYIALFAMGMIASATSLKPPAPGKRRLPWFAISALLAAAMAGAFFLQRRPDVHELWVRWFHISYRRFAWPLDILAGGAASAGLLAITRVKIAGGNRAAGGLLRFLESAPCAALGAFSYSLYLIHAPTVSLVQDHLPALHLSPAQVYLTMFAAGVPVGLLSGYLLFLTVERRFMPGQKSRSGSDR